MVPHYTSTFKPLEEIYKSIKSIHSACKFFGLELLSFTKNEEGNLAIEQSKHDFVFYLCYCSIFTMLGGYTTGTLFFEKDENLQSGVKSKFAILIMILIILMFLVIIANYNVRKKISSTLTAFGKIDTILHGFGMHINYDFLRKNNNGLMITLFTSVCVRCLLLIILIHLDVLQSVTVLLAISVKALSKYQFISYVKQLDIRFQRINDGLHEIFDKVLKNKIIFNHLNHENDIAEKILVICRLHYKLCQLMRALNKSFSFQELTSIAVSVCNILFQTYFLYYTLSGKGEVTFITISSPLTWMVDEIVEIQLLVSACAETCENANSTAVHLHEMRNGHYNIALEENVQTYSLQMLHQKIQFSAMGYFVIDYTLSYSIIGAVTTYLVIFIQFDQAQNSATVANTTTVGPSLLDSITTVVFNST